LPVSLTAGSIGLPATGLWSSVNSNKCHVWEGKKVI